jgi:hypothetical protein
MGLKIITMNKSKTIGIVTGDTSQVADMSKLGKPHKRLLLGNKLSGRLLAQELKKNDHGTISERRR